MQKLSAEESLEQAALIAETWAERNVKIGMPEAVIETAWHASKDIALLIRAFKHKYEREKSKTA